MNDDDWKALSPEQKVELLRVQIRDVAMRVQGISFGMDEFAARLTKLEEAAEAAKAQSQPPA